MTNDEYLAHHGILGMKWGVRRYQNYDGSYTKRGLARYNSSMSDYEQKKADYDSAKKSGADRNTVRNAKTSMIEAKRKVSKDYDQLKWDNKADRGKERYRRGERINDRAAFTGAIATIGGVAIGGAVWAQKNGLISQSISQKIMIGGAGAIAVSGLKAYFYDRPRDNELRAYYAH